LAQIGGESHVAATRVVEAFDQVDVIHGLPSQSLGPATLKLRRASFAARLVLQLQTLRFSLDGRAIRLVLRSECKGGSTGRSRPSVAKALEGTFLSTLERKVAERGGFERLLPLEAKSLN
jgi:hypothetical protein